MLLGEPSLLLISLSLKSKKGIGSNSYLFIHKDARIDYRVFVKVKTIGEHIQTTRLLPIAKNKTSLSFRGDFGAKQTA